MTRNFALSEFIESRFFNPDQQEKVWKSFRDDEAKLLPNAKKLAKNLQVLRDHFGRPISVNIAYRPKWYELLKGRKGGSKQVSFMAADIVVEGVSPYDVADAIELLIEQGKMAEGGLGRYNSFTHYDIRGKKARWDFRK